MINRIRDVRKHKRMTLADVAARCLPPTTAQTIGRLETGMRNLSLDWMNKIAAAADSHRVPAHCHRRRKLGALIIGAQALARIELAIAEVATYVEPGKRGFAQVDRYAAPSTPRRGIAGSPPRAFGGEFAFDEGAGHALAPVEGGPDALAKRTKL